MSDDWKSKRGVFHMEPTHYPLIENHRAEDGWSLWDIPAFRDAKPISYGDHLSFREIFNEKQVRQLGWLLG